MKRKILGMLLIIILTLGVTGCGKITEKTPEKDTSKEQNESTNKNEGKKPVSTKTITKEDVMNAPESPAEDFSYGELSAGTVYIDGYLGNDEIVVIPSKIDGKAVVDVGGGLFQEDKTTARAVRFPDSVEIIGGWTFSYSDNIEIVILGSGLKEIGECAFSDTSNLKELNLPEGLEKIGRRAIVLTGIETMEVPSSVVDLRDGAIMGMTVIGEPGSAIEEYAEEAFNVEFQAKSEDKETE